MDDPSSSDIPPVLDLFTSGPYVFGSRYVGLLRQAGGQSRVNDAFASPPSTEEEIIDPVAARAGQRGKRVATPTLAAGEQRSGKPDEFGAWSLYLVLASRLDPELSLHAAEGWGGDRYVGFTKRGTDGQECLRISVVGDTRADTGQLADAFSQWAAVLPAGAATSARVGDRVDVTACDTGSTTAADEATLDAAVTLLVDRNDIALELARAQAPPASRGARPTASRPTLRWSRCSTRRSSPPSRRTSSPAWSPRPSPPAAPRDETPAHNEPAPGAEPRRRAVVRRGERSGYDFTCVLKASKRSWPSTSGTYATFVTSSGLYAFTAGDQIRNWCSAFFTMYSSMSCQVFVYSFEPAPSSLSLAMYALSLGRRSCRCRRCCRA